MRGETVGGVIGGAPHLIRAAPRLFVAAWPPPPVVGELATLAREEPGVRWVRPDQLHVTLHFLGATEPEAVVERLSEQHLPAAVATLGAKVARLGRDVVMVPVSGLDELAAAVAAALAGSGRPPEPHAFRGHLTIARVRRRGPCSALGRHLSATFPVTEVVLVNSMLTDAGPVYERVATFPTV